MKSKILFFLIIVLLIGIKWGYDYIYSANATESNVLNFQNNNSSFDSVSKWMEYKNKMLQNIYDNKVMVYNLKSALMLEDILVKDKLGKQIECIEFNNNQLELCLKNYNLESVIQFQFFKINFNLQLNQNNQLINELVQKHKAILKPK